MVCSAAREGRRDVTAISETAPVPMAIDERSHVDVLLTVIAASPPSRTTVSQLLDDAPLSRFHRRAVVISGMGFFTDAYDLFVIGTVAAIVTTQWHLSTIQTSWVTGSAILGAFIGAFVFGRVADVIGRRTVYVSVAVIMVLGAVASALAPSLVFLIVARFVLGLGIGGDYPVSAVMMSEYSNRTDRGRLVGMVFSMQAVGLIVGPLVGLVLLSSGMSSSLTWRILLGVGAIPAAAVIYLRSKMPESPRFQSRVKGDSVKAASDLQQFAVGAVDASSTTDEGARLMGLREFLANRRMLVLLVGTAGSWFLFDYAYYGNTLSLPAICPLAARAVKRRASAANGYARARARARDRQLRLIHLQPRAVPR